MTFDRLHGPRQSLMRRLPTPLTKFRRVASHASWSIDGCFLRVPQQHPRHTVTVGLEWSNATGVGVLFGCGGVGVSKCAAMFSLNPTRC